MVNLSSILIDELTRKSINLYNSLPKTGKPIANEWTVLSSIIQHVFGTEIYEVVSIGTGSKCIGASKMSPKGDLINDSHAEVFVRRGFLLYLYDNIEYALEEKESIFTYLDNKFKLKDGIEFIFYSSQLPCGDVSIFPKQNQEEEHGDVLVSNKHKSESEISEVECKKAKFAKDIYRTGAKCLENSIQDPKEAGSKYHLLGQVRTKPGRGDRTLSMSCSDKMARWIHVGLQGALLDMLLDEPIHIKHFIFGGGVPYSSESLSRAFLNRNVNNTAIISPQLVPEFYQSSVAFPFIKSNDKPRPAPGSIVWIKTIEKSEVSVQGKKLGVTKKKANSSCGSLCISKANIYRRFINILRNNLKIRNNVVGDESLEKIPYNEMKRKSGRYLKKWLLVKHNFFHTWTVKPDMWNFCIEI